MKYKAYSLNNFTKIPQVDQLLGEEEKHTIKVVGNVLPFKVNNYVIDELIDWTNIPEDPIFQLTFPQKGMLQAGDFNKMSDLLSKSDNKKEIRELANEIRMSLNPHPAGQMDHNVPEIEDVKLTGVQHKYRETLLFFPNHGQTCHAYCTFCFRWPQFVGIDELKFAMRETELLVKYLQKNRKVTDILFTGGDPMIMTAERFRMYIDPILKGDLPHIKNIRVGSKALSYWPYKFTTDKDADDMLRLFEDVAKSGKHLAFMAHFNHPRELETPAVKEAVRRIRDTGAQIRSQSPVMKYINDDAYIWEDMWKKQVNLGIIPYYMFIARDTGAQDYFKVPIADILDIYNEAYRSVSGICRTVRGPSMSADPGKVHVVGITTIHGKKVFVLKLIQGRDPEWANQVFFAEYDASAAWLDELNPVFGEEEFFFQQGMENYVRNL